MPRWVGGDLVARIRRRLRPTREHDSTGFVDFGAFADTVAIYRARGTKIGEKVRLLGHVDGVNPHLVTIGDYAVIGAASALLAHCPIKGPLPVTVGRFVYIAYGALILPGVTLGDFCVIGAGAVVTKSTPPESVVAGNPARVIRKLTKPERDHIERVLLEGRIFAWDPARPA
jgi:acetyltransferase-like isoleucine patch superfamily enzyme